MDKNVVRALTYNVRRDVSADGEYDWMGRRRAVASTIRFHRPDVLGLQEPLPHQYDDIRDDLPDYEWVGRSRGANEREEEYCPVGYRPGRFERLDGGTFWLSETPDQPGTIGWDGDWPRILTWVRLRERETDRRLTYCNTHLDHQGEQARHNGVSLILDRLPDLRDDTPAVVAGDFNCEPDGEPYAILTGKGDEPSPLTDARAASAYPPHGPNTTRTDFESLIPDSPIDHVFVDGLAVENFGVAADAVDDGWYPSDHMPVVADLSL